MLTGEGTTLRQVSLEPDPREIELSVVMPCLNEAATLAVCIEEAVDALSRAGISGEVVISDNGSTDGSQEIAKRLGARVVSASEKGYGSALRTGIEASRGRYILMGDSDASYCFAHASRFVEKLRGGYELVLGNRFAGGIEPGAMPWLNRYVGNPVLTAIGQLLFRCRFGDFHCGLRAIDRKAYDRLQLSTTGMEFASEMIARATLKDLRIGEVPTVLRPDGRSRPPHLRRCRDGWRHLRFMLLLCPRWLFMIPGGLLLLLGLAVMGAIGGSGVFFINGVGFSINTMLMGGMTVIAGYQICLAGLFARALGARVGSHPPQSLLALLGRRVTLEHGLLAGAAMITGGVLFMLRALATWQSGGLGPLPTVVTTQNVIPASVLFTAGIQTVFSSFLFALLDLLPRPAVREENA